MSTTPPKLYLRAMMAFPDHSTLTAAGLGLVIPCPQRAALHSAVLVAVTAHNAKTLVPQIKRARLLRRRKWWQPWN